VTAGTGEPDGREWLEANGLGGYAMSTVTGENTRRYHGLLVAAMRPPVSRAVLLSKVEDTLLVGGRRIDLSTNLFPENRSHCLQKHHILQIIFFRPTGVK